MTETTLSVTSSLESVGAGPWNRLAGEHPFLRYEFLETLHATGCASRQTGWRPEYLLLRRGDELVGAMPLYLKSHSRGEYVFDQAWANAFERNGLPYYPKLVCAVPFSPVTGPRLLAADHDDRVLLARAGAAIVSQLKVSSLHVLFPNQQDIEALKEAGYMLREGVQFHWENAGFENFEQFLAAMSHDKRKKIRQDRRRVSDAGVRFRWLRGAQIDAASLDFFYRCYASTYESHWSSPYLTPEFFQRIRADMPDNMLLVIGDKDGAPVAAALNMVGGDTMYGRYWGATEFVSGLHFETCYMQGIEYCIAHGLARFEGGAQGVHKMSRGLLPTATWSAHHVADPRFASAIAEFLDSETAAMDDYLTELEAHTPFKRTSAP
ncbi:MAG: GNAT family N-acetyltransferase [Janthinobacterium lividum]